MSSTRKWLRRTAVVAGGALLVSLTGCDQDQQSIDLSNAAARVKTLDGVTSGVDSGVMGRVDEVIGELTPLAGADRDDIAGPASLLLAQTYVTQGSISAAQMSSRLGAVRDRFQVVLAGVDRYVRSVDAAAAFSPPDENAAEQLRSKATAAQQSLTEARQRAEDLSEQISSLRAAASQKRDRAESLRERGAALIAQAAEGNARDRAAAQEQAYSLGRQAGALEVEASEDEMRANGLVPAKSETDILIGSLGRQIGDFNTLAAQAQESANTVRQNRALLEQEATDAARALRDTIDALNDRRESAEAPADAARQSLETAARFAQQAGSRSKGTLRNESAFLKGRAGIARATIHATLSREAADWAEMLGGVANAEPALPDADRYRQEAMAAAQRAEEQKTLAVAAYREAIDELERANVRGDTGEMLENALTELRRLTGAENEEPAQPTPPPPPAEQPAAGES